MRASMLTLLLVAALAAGPDPAGAQQPAISLTAAPAQVVSPHALTLSGRLSDVTTPATVTIYQNPYPYSAETALGTVTTDAAGAFSISARPDRNTRYRAVAGSLSSSPIDVGVSGRVIAKVEDLPLGRARVTIVVFHPGEMAWNGARVRWWFASGRHGVFRTAPATTTRRLSQYVTVLRTSVALPAGRFSYRACFTAPATGALLDPKRPAGCDGWGYQGGGSLPGGFPGPKAVARAARYLAGRLGRKAFAVVDTEGRLAGVNVHWTFPTASVVKAMLLVAYLRRLDARGQHSVDSYSNSFLYPMIHVSDNNAATQCWSIVGDSGLYGVARIAGMTDFSVSGLWGTALLSPADQARFFFEMDSLIPKEFVGYARHLLSTIIAWQAFGMPPVARPLGYQVFFKDGSEPTALGQLVHQVARFEGHHRVFSIAVMTDGDPTMQYGIDTLAGVARALLG